MTFDNQAKLGKNLNEIGKVLGLESHLPAGSASGDLGSLYLSSDHYLDAIREFRQALDNGWKSTAPLSVQEDVREKLAWCYFWTGSYSEAERILDHQDALVVEKPGILLLRGRIALERGDLDTAERYAGRTLEIAAENEAMNWIGPARSLLGIVIQRKGGSDEAREHFEEALLAFRVAHDTDGECRSYIHLGTLSKTECRWEEALRYLQKARAKADEEGFYYLFGSSSLNLGNLRFRLGEYDKAYACAAEAHRVFQEIGYQLGITRSLVAEARIHILRGEFARVRECLDLGADLCRAGNFKREKVHLEIFEGEAAILIGDELSAERHYRIARHLAEEISPTSEMAVTANLHLAQFLVQRGDIRGGRELLSRIADSTCQLGDPAQAGWLQRLVAEADLADHNYEDAEREIARAIADFERIGYRQELAQALIVAGRILASSSGALSQTDKVLTHLLRAKRIWEELSSDRDTALACIDISRYWLAKDDLDEAFCYLQTAGDLFEKVSDDRGIDQIAEFRKIVEARLSEQVHRRRKANRTNASSPTGTLDEALEELLQDAARETHADRALLAVGPNGAELKIISTHGLTGREGEAVLSRLLSRNSGFLEGNKPIFDSGPTRSNGGDDATSAILLPFEIDDRDRGVLYVERADVDSPGWFRVGEVQKFAGITYDVSVLIAEEQKTALRRENSYLKEKLENRFPLANIVTGDPRMLETLDIAARVASYPITVLIEGETGTGKQLLAQAIHSTGNRVGKPFITVNCASLPEQILESELFGYVKGAFTGALHDRKGLFEEADGGTILLDEIGKAGPHVQRALLHVLDQSTIRPVGASTHRSVDVRVVCATSNMRLKEDISEGAFLKDLFYRINDINLRLPPLRERRSDVRLLSDYFFETFTEKVGRTNLEMSPEFLAALDQYNWPGNVRELEKAIQRAILLAPGRKLTVADLPEELRTAPSARPGTVESGLQLKEEVERLEITRIREALDRNSGNRSRTARELGLSLRGLRNKIQRYELEEE